jgi:hypothetical protein
MRFTVHVDSEARLLTSPRLLSTFFPLLPFSFPPVFLASPVGVVEEAQAWLQERALASFPPA